MPGMTGFFCLLVALVTSLDAAQVAQLALQRSPQLQAAQARVEEARALRVGAGVWAPSNPELAIQLGPGFADESDPTLLQFLVALKWPLEVSGAFAVRRDLADAHVAEAEAELATAQRAVLAAALDLFMRAAGAQAHSELARARLTLDEDLLRSARVRRDAGATGDADVALATVLQAESQAGLLTAQAEAEALLVALRQHLGQEITAPEGPLTLPEPAAPTPLDSLLSRLPQRPDLLLTRAAEGSAQLRSSLQDRLAWPVPRLTLEGARNPQYTANIGLELPLPVYQRNQTNAAVARAQWQSRQLDTRLAERLAEAELRAAHTRCAAAVAAHASLRAAAAAMDDAEHLAQRGFALGHIGLASWVAARREIVQARQALIDAHAAAARAQVALALAAGEMP